MDRCIFVSICLLLISISTGQRPKEGKLNINSRKFRARIMKLVSCSTLLSMKFIMLINVKMPTVCCHFNIYQHDEIQHLRV